MSPPPAQESRRHPRFAVQIEAVVSHGQDQMSSITKDMSRGGICLVCPRKIPAGANVRLSLSLILGADSFSETLLLTARVVWCTQIDKAFQVGAVFTDMGREKTGYLEMFLRFLQQEVLVAGIPDQAPPAKGPFDTGDADDA